MSKVLEEKKYNVKSTDLISRGYGIGNINFLTQKQIFKGDIITNPPYKYANEFILHALYLVQAKSKVAMFLPVRFLSGKKRSEIFKKFPPKIIYVASSRINCAKNGNFNTSDSGAMDYAWFIWEKGFSGNTQTKWFN